ncbi:hypothetical protein MSAR_24390 [Mycolicibacterium sarraceniae]|uniref:Uncharacterized protein n=1 Tax=Mycolicibacterium sarraceniae TaxID=1534348 RepID=A0A7I7SRF2_9MYCO|nr:hypothetical protein MSAR_24390 [Mycolicibacterium sarraceniae]
MGRFNRIPGGVAVLGQMTARVDRVPRLGEQCMAVATSDWRDGRKIGALHRGRGTSGGRPCNLD